MINWQEILQQLQRIVNTIIRFAKARRREEAAIGLAALLFWIGFSVNNLVPERLQDAIKSWNGDLIIPGVFYVAGLIFLGYGIYRIWKLSYTPDLPPPANRPSVIKGPLAFTPADGELFRKLGREDELRKLLGYIQDDQVSLVVLMGASGAGKTSLLRAGLTDILKNTDINYHYWEAKASDSRQSLLLAIQQSWKTDGNPQPTLELGSLDDLVNATSEFGKHVIVLDQFEQLGVEVNGPVFRHLRKIARSAKPPHRITWVIAFRREYRASWSDFIIPEQERSFFPPELSLRLFTSKQARDVISQLIQVAGLSVEQKVVDNLIDAATVDGEVSSVDIGIGLLVLSELHERQGGKTLTEDIYHFAGGAEGLLTQYINRCLNNFPDEDRKTLLSALLALGDENTGQRIAEGKTYTELAAEIRAENVLRLKTELERLTQRDIRLLERVDTTDGVEIHYRLPHERLIPAINRLAGKLIGEREEAKLKLVSAFSAWRNNHAPQYFLKGRDLRLVEQYQNQIPWGSDEPEKLNFLKRSKRRRTARRLISIALIFSILAGGWLGNLKYQRYEAMRYLRENNYPPELYDYQHQLVELDLTEPFNLKYIPFLNSDTFEELTIIATSSTNSLEGLAHNLTRCPHLKILRLNLSDSEVKELPPLPNNLTELSLTLSGSQGQELPPLPNTLTKLSLDLRGSEVKELPPLPNNLTELSLTLGGSQELPPLPNTLTKLSLNLDSEVKVPPLPNTLAELSLDLSDSRVKELPPLPNTLAKLSLTLSGSEVKELPPLPNTLTELSLTLFGSQELPPLPNTLTKLSLNLRGSEVKELPPLPNNLTELSLTLFGSRVKELPPLPNNLTELSLDFSISAIKELPPLPNTLTKLSIDLRDSEVKELPPLPNNLTELSLTLGSEVKVPPLPNTLTKLSLDLGSSRVKELPPLPNNLTELSLTLGSEVKVPPLPNTLAELSLDLSGSRVKELPPLPNNLAELSLDLSNSAIKELSPLQQLNCQTLNLQLSTDQRMSLKTLPRSVTHLKL